ncbi:CHAP domain-containing protein [Pendulispora brunnea]|uniref:CHAP domain-containing protein n=1 Tax=Pendulispora brunnea TaxID=2905690 RepID=A0ABZ2K6U2_9BACT
MRAWWAVANVVVLSQCVLAGCSSSSSSNETATPMHLRGAYRATTEGTIREITFGDEGRYSLWRSPCGTASRCRESGTYALNDAHSEIGFTNERTGEKVSMPFHALHVGGGGGLGAQGLVGGDGKGLVQDQVSLVSSFQAGQQNFQANECTVGGEIAQHANDNLGKGACDTTSTGEHAFGSSCTGNGGSPEEWCADFAKWVWASTGKVDVDGLSPAAGSFYLYGKNHGTLNDTPHVGDAVVFNSNGGGYADHVALVTVVNDDGTIQSVSGNWNGPNGPSTSKVMTNMPSYSGTVGSTSSTMGGYRIDGFISPACNTGSQ